MKRKRFTLRFNLGAGENFMKWKLTDRVEGKGLYFDPEYVQFRLINCTLRNHQGVARKIHSGAHKAVCAWVEFNVYEIISPVQFGEPVLYNPREAPHWVLKGLNADGCSFPELLTIGRRVYLTGEVK